MSRRHRERGFTLVEVLVATAVLGMAVTVVLGGLLYGMTEARRGKQRAEAAAWVQSELDFLRLHGYPSNPNPNPDPQARTLTQTTGYICYGSPMQDWPDCTGGIGEPQIPAGFDRAEIRAENDATLPLRKLTVVLYETPTSQPYVILSTYVANFTYALPP